MKLQSDDMTKLDDWLVVMVNFGPLALCASSNVFEANV